VIAPEDPDRSFEPIATRRTYAPQRKGKRIEDAHDRAIVFQALAWSPAGAILGVAAGVAAVVMYDQPLWVLVLCALVGWALVFFLPLLLTRTSSRAGELVYTPSGKSTPKPKEHSRAEALIVRGLYEDAVRELATAVEEDPTDHEAALRIARVLRDDVGDHEGSASWFARALACRGLPEGRVHPLRKELVELYVHRLHEPRRAAPVLARMAEELEGSSWGEWARDELVHVKALMLEESTDG
jgi:hypothetical protein